MKEKIGRLTFSVRSGTVRYCGQFDEEIFLFAMQW